ncbi:hypothetical protein [Devosia sp.]|uniref:hypothetical protein n=1 Tax=Devosia sp. TaxID=1871048 RepID=UPI002AFEB0F7|nr:hypothetical protein [Devosia sp.]
MAALKNARHERFAQGLASGKTAEEAYVEAGFRPNRGNAARLKANESIRARAKELTERAAEGVVLTRQWVLEQLADNAAKAKKVGDFGPSNKAIELIGKHLGMFAGSGGDDDETPPSLNIDITVRDAVGDVRITKPEQTATDIS